MNLTYSVQPVHSLLVAYGECLQVILGESHNQTGYAEDYTL